MHEGVNEFSDMVPTVDMSQRERLGLVIIDMQYHDASPERGLTRAWERVHPGSMEYYSKRLENVTVGTISRLLDYFRRNELAVVHVVLGSDYVDLRDCPPRFRAWTRNVEAAANVKDIWWTGNPDFEVIEPLAPRRGETVIRKTTNGAYNGSEIDRTLGRMGLTSLVITGVVTSACVETTARDAADRGYDCILVSDGCADYDSDMHEATLKAFSLNFGRVVESADELIRAIEEGVKV